MPAATTLTVNGIEHTVHAESDTPLLYVLRNDLKLKGAKFGCGMGQCGSCTVLIDGHNVTACDTPLWAATGKSITTIEGLGSIDAPNVLQQAFIAEQAAQCGYCVSGIIMTATALLKRNPHPDQAEIKKALERNLCRCGTHTRIIKAIQRAATALSGKARGLVGGEATRLREARAAPAPADGRSANVSQGHSRPAHPSGELKR